MQIKNGTVKINDFVSDNHDVFTKAIVINFVDYDVIEYGKRSSRTFCKVKVTESKFKSYIGQYLDVLPEDLNMVNGN